MQKLHEVVTPVELRALLSLLHAEGYRLLEVSEHGVKVVPVEPVRAESAQSGDEQSELTPGQKQEAELDLLLMSSGSSARPRLRTPPKASEA